MNILDFENNEINRPISTIDIRVKQRNGRKMTTLVEGLASDLDLNKIAKYLRRHCKTSSAVLSNEGFSVIPLAGDKREIVKEFLVKYNIWETPDPQIKVHGF